MVGVSYLQDDAHKNVGRSDKSSPPPSAVANATSPHTPSLLSTSQPMMRRGDLGKHHIVGGGKTFRSRKIDFNKEITVLLESAEPEEHLLQMRSVPLLSTGVEKEEEDEAHLKAILSSAPTFSRMGGGEGARIPVPDSTDVGHSISGEIYEQLYPPTGEAFKKDERWKTPPQPRILDALHNPFYSNHGPAGLYCQNNLLGFGYGTRAPMTLLPCEGETIKGRTLPYVPYWATGDDLIFLTKLTPRLDISTFEKVMWVIESIALVFGHDGVVNSNFLTTKQAVVFIDRWLDPSELKIALSYQSAIFEHWKKTRAAISPSLVVPLLPTLKLEDQQGKIGNSSSSGSANSNIDPYVCFRRREIRQPRKTRRADLEALTKLSRLQEQFEDLLLLLRISLQRDQLKKSLLLEGTLVFGNTFTLESLKSKYGIHVPPIQISASESSNHRHIGHHHGQGSLISSHGRAKVPRTSVSYANILTRADLEGPPAMFMDISSHSYAKVAFFMNMANANDSGVQCSLPFENISPWKSIANPVKICNDISSRLKEFEEELNSYHKEEHMLFQNLQKEALPARERFEMALGSTLKSNGGNPSRPLAYRLGRGGRIVALRRDM